MQNEKVRNIVNTIVKEVLKPEDLSNIEKKLVDRFSAAGYDSEEIRKAFDIVLSLVSQRVSLDRIPGSGKAMRVLTERERLSLSDEASSWLLGLYYKEEIRLFELEEVLAQIVAERKTLNVKDTTVIVRKTLKRSFQRNVVNFN